MATRDDPNAAAALAAAITSSKRSDDAPTREQFQGRVDRTRLSRLACRDRRVFQRTGQPAPKKLRVFILMDGSGSMGAPVMSESGVLLGTRFEVCEQMARNLALATERLPNVTASVWCFSSGVQTFVARLWDSGQPTSNIARYRKSIAGGGNTDGVAIQYVSEDLIAETKRDEQPMLIVVSDGQPSRPEIIPPMVKKLREKGVAVVSVSIAPDLPPEYQTGLYGRDYVIPFSGSYKTIARNMAKVMGKALG